MESILPKKTISQKPVEKLNNNQIEFLLNDIIDKQHINVIRKINPTPDGTLVLLLVENEKKGEKGRRGV